MIYMVECAFTDPAREQAWNAFYDEDKLPTLLALPGFRTSQRFRALTDLPAPYLAVHSVRDAVVLDRTDYRAVGGGTFSGWDDLVTSWSRNLFSGMEATPEVSEEECLVVLDDPGSAHATSGADFAWLDIAGLDRTATRRGIAIVGRAAGEALARDGDSKLRIYNPITARMVSPHGIDN